MSAEARREDVVGIAFRHFAEGGFDGTSTEDIAREAGVSQPYLFRLFKTKRGLFEACADKCFAQVRGVFEAGVAGETPEERLEAMGHAYEAQLLPDRHALLFQMRAFAVADPEIRAHVRGGFEGLRATVAGLASVPLDETWDFFGSGMLLNVVTMLEIEWVHPK
ncbi:TetR/AcrR family transcriptional regulator [Solirubrobacter taibaiensis]|nr:TetR/AcrR family transcriptional regulator [Solirubrobacter taibaiensis]